MSAGEQKSSCDASDARLRVLLVFSSRNIGGAERSLTRMALQGAHSVDYKMLTVGGEGDWSVWARGLGAQIEVFHVFSWRWPRSMLRFLRCCREFRPDIVYMVGLRSAILLRLIRGLIPATYVHAIRSTFPAGSEMRRKFALPERLLQRLTDHYIANSQVGARDIQAMTGAAAEQVSVVYNGLAHVEPISVPFASRPVRVVVVANISGQKGHLEFLPIVRSVRAELPELQVWFVGRNDIGRELHAGIVKQGLTGVIHELGYCESPESVLRLCRVFALPTRHVEGCPTAIIEAMAVGMPVVAYAVGGIPEIVVSGFNGILLAPGDADGFAQALTRLLRDPELSERLGRQARNSVHERFSLQRCAAEHEAIWQRLVTSGATVQSR